MKIGVLALQGDFSEHISMLKSIGVHTAEVRLPKHLDGLDGLIIPGGESTTIGKLAVAYNLMASPMQFGEPARARSFFQKTSGSTSPYSD
jgi:5'-phosphate synthase pdxT subunit